MWKVGFPGDSGGKGSACYAGDPGSIPELGRSPAEGNGYPLQYSCLENSMDRGAWRAIVHGVAKNQMQLSNFHFFLMWKVLKSITVQYYTAQCVGWVPRLTLLLCCYCSVTKSCLTLCDFVELINKLDLLIYSQNGACLYVGDLLCYTFVHRLYCTKNEP